MPAETIAGRYRVEREIGRGGMGSVWLCRDEVLGRAVAIKQVGRLPGESSTDLARAMREARSSAALSHRNVVAVYDALEVGDRVLLVMEYVGGRTLAQLMADDGPLPPERVARIGAQVADGLAAAHARRIVHRDVKPGNILVADDDVAKISDFGIARTHGDQTLTQTGLVIGTPAYFAPELARGAEASPASDVWALGATLYAAVEGRGAFPDQANPLAMLSTIASERPAAPRLAGPLAAPIGRMMDPAPQSRWSMADAANALHLVAEGGTLGGEAAATTTIFPISGVAPAATPEVAPEPPQDSERDSRRRRAGLLALLALLLVAAIGGWLLWGSSGDETSPSAGSEPSSHSPSASHSPSPSRTASHTPSPKPSPTPTHTAAPSSAQMAGFVDDYYGVLPSDTKAGWSMLSPGFQSEVGSYGSYQGFWKTIDAVTVNGTSPAGPDAVDASLTYTRDDGSTASETRRLYLQPSGGSYVITGDDVVG